MGCFKNFDPLSTFPNPLSQASQQRGPGRSPTHCALPLQQPLQRRFHARAPQSAAEAALVATWKSQ